MKSIISVLAVLLLGMCSCQSRVDNSAEESEAMPDSIVINDSIVMKYVRCPKSTINKFISVGDSVYAQTHNYTLRDLGLRNDRYNEWLVTSYGDTIPLIVSIYDSYDRITGSDDVDEADGAFIWHEVAKAQIIGFIKKGGCKANDADIGKVLLAMKNVIDYYSAGNQSEMTIAANRLLVVADYHLLTAYIRLMDCFPSDEIKQLVHKDYEFLIDTVSQFFELSYEKASYSDLSRELYTIFCDVLMSKAASINKLLETNADDKEVINNLSAHICLIDGKSISISKDIIGHYFHGE